MKTCSTCSVEKDISLFSVKRVKKDGTLSYRAACKECTRKQNLDVYHNKGGKAK